MIGSLTPQWHLRLVVGTQETVLNKAFDDWVGYFDQNRPLWESNATTALQNASGSYQTVADAIVLADSRLADARRVNGQRPQDQRSPNGSLNTTYSFGTGFLRGVRVGGGFRWASNNIIGYARDAGGNLDLTRPFEGPENFSIDASIGYSRRILGDKATWDIQLNLFNLLDEDDILPRQAVDDGTGNPIYVRTALKEPMSAQLTSSISF